ncbi:hypothetical protein JOE65_000277 [Arthrobacter roseus]|nr:hypothetical protein [Arthrobacter roseus]
MESLHPGLSDGQLTLIHTWLGPVDVVHDHSWPLQDTNVLRVRSASCDYIVKASSTSHHIRREITAYRAGFKDLDGRVPEFIDGSIEAACW